MHTELEMKQNSLYYVCVRARTKPPKNLQCCEGKILHFVALKSVVPPLQNWASGHSHSSKITPAIIEL